VLGSIFGGNSLKASLIKRLSCFTVIRIVYDSFFD
jgi:hypothetical protein